MFIPARLLLHLIGELAKAIRLLLLLDNPLRQELELASQAALQILAPKASFHAWIVCMRPDASTGKQGLGWTCQRAIVAAK